MVDLDKLFKVCCAPSLPDLNDLYFLFDNSTMHLDIPRKIVSWPWVRNLGMGLTYSSLISLCYLDLISKRHDTHFVYMVLFPHVGSSCNVLLTDPLPKDNCKGNGRELHAIQSVKILFFKWHY